MTFTGVLSVFHFYQVIIIIIRSISLENVTQLGQWGWCYITHLKRVEGIFVFEYQAIHGKPVEGINPVEGITTVADKAIDDKRVEIIVVVAKLIGQHGIHHHNVGHILLVR
eukprot:CAMPEP_0168529040 /NCGR_PEP_ID=MMETSP0405-20121227/13645_1 /TAXON_ID=498012 /ORGANISM="Trichosphaerium sp, Strain Am-I-7 wt" /LENGTH=110 /DNA_ID=CAMNT_0008552635 /DNA_START=286 /DNA_END=618 /DNA_ORIENTATION=-